MDTLIPQVYSPNELERPTPDRKVFNQFCKSIMAWFCVYGLSYSAIKGGLFPALKALGVRVKADQGKAGDKWPALYMLSMGNAGLLTGYGVYHYFLKGWKAPQHRQMDLSFFGMVSIIGYLLHDLMQILPEWKTNIAFIFHHCVVIALGFACRPYIPYSHTMSPPMALQEVSTLFFNVVWFSKVFPFLDEKVDMSLLRIGFRISFALIRCGLFPYSVAQNFKMWMEKNPVIGYGFVSFCGLQYYWLLTPLIKALRATKKTVEASGAKPLPPKGVPTIRG